MQKIQAQKTFSRGIAMGPIHRLERQELAPLNTPAFRGVEAEGLAYEQAVAELTAQLADVAADNEIFAGHLAIAGDPMLAEAVKSKIESEMSAAEAVDSAIEELAAIFAAMDDPYLREREADVRDVGQRLSGILRGHDDSHLYQIDEPSVIIARDLLPSDTARLPREKVLGFLTELGGVTSHVAIISKSLGIPALVGVTGLMEASAEAKAVAFDAATGEIVIDPDEQEQERFRERQEAFAMQEAAYREAAEKPAITLDGRSLKVYANLGSGADIAAAAEFRPDGIGLFRTEFLFMDGQDWPSEEKQYSVYKEALESVEGREMILRTLDIGGDKALPYYHFPEEENPFLGWRAIRFCLDRREIFKTQLKAALRAAVHGELKLMYPMLISLAEIREAKALLREAADELEATGMPYAIPPQGIMIETPAAVMMADELAREVDFFSIGTNDLTQYILACDRGNPKLSELYNPLDPAILRAIKQVIDAGHRAGIEVGMCGEFAGRSDVTEVLLGFGLDEFSMAAGDMALIKKRLQELSFQEAQKLAEQILELTTAAEVEARLKA